MIIFTIIILINIVTSIIIVGNKRLLVGFITRLDGLCTLEP